MSNEPALRAALHEYAGHAPGSGGLLEAVRVRSHRRRRRRRRRQLAAAAGVAVLVAVAGPVVAVQMTTAGPVPQGEPDARQPAIETGLPATETALVESYQLESPDFPFTPGWVPPEATSTSYEHHEFGLLRLTHLGPDGQEVISAEVNPADPDHPLRSLNKLMAVVAGSRGQQDQQDVTVQGRDAVLMTATSSEFEDEDEPQPPTTVAAVSWLHEPGLRVGVSGSDPDDVLRYAEALQHEPNPTQVPFTFAAMPPDARLGSVGSNSMMLRPTGPSGDDFLSVRLLSRDADPAGQCREGRGPSDEPPLGACSQQPEQVQVGGNEAQRYGEEMLVVHLPDGTLLRIAAAGSLALSPDDLVRFAAGVQVTEYAVPASD